MPEGIALTELAVGGGAGIAATLTAAALFFRRKTVAMDEEKVRLDDEHKAKLEQQSTEHAARLEVLAAERDKAASGAATDATSIANLVTETVEKLLPEAVAKVQAIERARVAHDRAREQALAETIKAALKEMQAEDK